jgi:hypothetical protein
MDSTERRLARLVYGRMVVSYARLEFCFDHRHCSTATASITTSPDRQYEDCIE